MGVKALGSIERKMGLKEMLGSGFVTLFAGEGMVRGRSGFSLQREGLVTSLNRERAKEGKALAPGGRKSKGRWSALVFFSKTEGMVVASVRGFGFPLFQKSLCSRRRLRWL
ncbi:hypothetical protein NC653_007991 [Populus alba x Populus x berolinensis]|uniref:Uncharacterized protein n=2 Tax=Populus TaxID=3689 RepID=A0A4U5MNQ6_POPAL|nr:hypothetical protein NC653_007991 [Populus alba x Populus x berolinensis]TKR71256.1 hypothetical protein D5086_0000302790 [Populus alba]